MRCFNIVLALSLVTASGTKPWYHGIDSITVFSPPPEPDRYLLQEEVDRIYKSMEEDAFGNASSFQKGQFGAKRRAILLTSGDYGSLKIPVNWYTTLIGVGLGAEDVEIEGFLSVDAYPTPDSVKGGLENFWKSVEGVTTRENTTQWVVSQAAPLRRSVIKGNLWLSETDERNGTEGGKHYTSGGYLADVKLHGTLNWGTQQQFFFRNSDMPHVDHTGSGKSFVFVGVEGAPYYNKTQGGPLISNVRHAPAVAEKPYLVELNNKWFIKVPEVEKNKRGASDGTAEFRLIPMEEVFIAKEGDTSETIQAGIRHKRALLFTPAIYGLKTPIRISQPNFVVLGIGMASLVATNGMSAIIVEKQATDAQLAGVLIEGGTPLGKDATEPLLVWRGNRGIVSDLFTRVGVFGYETDFHESCLVTRADMMVVADGDDMIFDNAWLWHADHDDCTEGLGTDHTAPPASDKAFSATGLRVNGDNVIGYGLAVEHTKHDLLHWEGENGQVFFFQSELPYRSNLNFGEEGWNGFKVGYGVKDFTGYGIGVYQVFNTYVMDTSFRFPKSVKFYNMFTWCITGNRSGLGYLGCAAPGVEDCIPGDCNYNSCQLFEYPQVNSSSDVDLATVVV